MDAEYALYTNFRQDYSDTVLTVEKNHNGPVSPKLLYTSDNILFPCQELDHVIDFVIFFSKFSSTKGILAKFIIKVIKKETGYILASTMQN